MHHPLARTWAFVFIASLPALAQNGPWTQVCNLNTSGNWETWGYTTGDTDISADGRYVVFVTAWYLDPADPGWADVYMRDLVAGTTTAVSRGQGGVWGNYDSISPSISATGRYVAFQSAASNLTPNGGGGSSIYLRDTVASTTVRCSIGAGGVIPNDICIEPDISSDGRYVSFVSPATNLLPNPNAYRQVFVWDR
jgi:Tol biopolymer transport system component